MEEANQQKLKNFLTSIDREIKEIKDYLVLEKGSELLDSMTKWEEENAQYLGGDNKAQDELDKRKIIIRFLIFPIISDNKVEELLQYHALDAIDAGLDLEELMYMRAITISELVWPQISQRYTKALMQNAQLLGSEPLIIKNEKSSFLPYIKNWISAYNRQYGIEKHEGLEAHKFVIEDANAKRLQKEQKESLLKLLKFYESLKVYSLSKIEAEMGKIRTRMPMKAPPGKLPAGTGKIPAKAPLQEKKPVVAPSKIEDKTETYKAPAFQPRSQIKIVQDKPKEAPEKKPMISHSADKKPESADKLAEPVKSTPDKPKEIVKLPILELLEKYPHLGSLKVTSVSISNPSSPFSLAPTVQNWINHYSKERGKGHHTFDERGEFLESMQRVHGLSMDEVADLKRIFLSVDEKAPLPYDAEEKKLLLDHMEVGNKLKNKNVGEVRKEKKTDKSHNKREFSQKPADEDYDLGIELVPAKKQ